MSREVTSLGTDRVAIPVSKFLELLELETRVKIIREAYERDRYLCGTDVAKILNLKEGEKHETEMDRN